MRRRWLLLALSVAIVGIINPATLWGTSCDVPNGGFVTFSPPAVPASCAVTDPTANPASFNHAGGASSTDGGPNLTCARGATLLAGTATNMPDLGAGIGVIQGRLTFAVLFTGPNGTKYYFTPITTAASAEGGAGEIQECSCDTGNIIAARAMNQICSKVLDSTGRGGFYGAGAYLLRDGATDILPGGDADRPVCILGPNDNKIWYVRRNDMGGGFAKCGFKIRKTGNDKFYVEPDNPCTLDAVYTVSSHANFVGEDLKKHYLVQVDPNGVNGVVQFQIRTRRNAGGNPSTFSVDTTGKTISQIQSDVAAGFNGLGFGTIAAVETGTANSQMAAFAAADPVFGENPQLGYAGGQLVHIENANEFIADIHVKGLTGQRIRQENWGPEVIDPALNGPAMVVLCFLLLLSGYYLVRRQRRSIA